MNATFSPTAALGDAMDGSIFTINQPRATEMSVSVLLSNASSSLPNDADPGYQRIDAGSDAARPSGLHEYNTGGDSYEFVNDSASQL